MARKAWPFIKALLRLAWAWRWPALLLATPLLGLIMVAGVSPRIGAVGSLLVAGPVLGRSPRARSLSTTAAKRSRVIAWDVYWPFLCGLCGFVEPTGRRARIAGLEHIEFGPGNWVRPDWVRFTITPCATHDPATWDRYEHRLRRRLRYGSSTWTTPAGDPNVMVITCRRDPLPTLWALDTHVPASMLARPEWVYLGTGADGGDIVWTPDEPGKAMLFIGGRQGGGKGVLARSIFTQALTHRWRLWVCNPKRVGEFAWLGPHASVAKTPAGMFAMIAAFRVELDRRADVLDTYGVADWHDLPTQVAGEEGMGHRDALVIDEFVTLMTMKGTVPLIPPPEGAPKGARPIDPYAVMVGDLQAIAAMGRALGMTLVLLTQHPISEHMGPFGSTIKANLGARIAIGSVEAEGAGSLFGKAHGETIAQLLRTGVPGRCVYDGLTTTNTAGWQLGQALHIATDQLARFLPTEPTHLPVSFDHKNEVLA